MLRTFRNTSLRNRLHRSTWKSYRSRLRVEELEQRNVPSTLTPAQVRHAYGFDQVTFSGGTVAGDGTGQTIAIVDAYHDSHIGRDLQKFNSTFGLPNPTLTQASFTSASADAAGWSIEIALDVEWAHAVAPKAKILLVEAASSYLNDLMTAVDYARNYAGVTTVSMSWGIDEVYLDAATESYYDGFFTTPAGHSGVTFVASSGDSGAGNGPSWPAISPNVLSVGGTHLNVTGSNGTWSSETGWSGSGGGVSAYESEPSYQTGVQSTGKRTNPDVAYDADPGSGFYVYNRTWYSVGGTSAGSPQWAGLLAVANQGRALAGLGSIHGAQAAVYQLPASDFHDITTGSNGPYSAGPGYDYVTGLGTPKANQVIAHLVSSSIFAPTIGGGTTGGSTSGGTSGPSGSGKPGKPTQPITVVTDQDTNDAAETAALLARLLSRTTAQSVASAQTTTSTSQITPIVITTNATGAASALSTISSTHLAGSGDDLLTPETMDKLPDQPGRSATPTAPDAAPAAPAEKSDRSITPADLIMSQARDAYFTDPCWLDEAPAMNVSPPAAPMEEGGASVDPFAGVAGLALVLGGYWGRGTRDDERSRQLRRMGVN